EDPGYSTALANGNYCSPPLQRGAYRREKSVLKDGEFYVQEFLRVLAKISHEQPHVPRKPREVVIEFRVVKKFPYGGFVGIELCRRGGKIFAGLLVLHEQGVIRRELSECSFAPPHIRKKRVAVVDEFFRAFVHLR